MASKLHPGQCSFCSLCKKSNPRYTHPTTMKEKQREGYTLLKLFKPNIADTECICAPCAKQLTRNISNPNFHPRWLPKPSKTSTKCNIESCEHPVYSRTNLVTVHRLQEMFHRGLYLMSSQGRAYRSDCALIITCKSTVNRSSNATLEEVRMDNSNVAFIYSE